MRELCILEEWKWEEVSGLCAEGGMDKFIVHNCLTGEKIWGLVNINAWQRLISMAQNSRG